LTISSFAQTLATFTLLLIIQRNRMKLAITTYLRQLEPGTHALGFSYHGATGRQMHGELVVVFTNLQDTKSYAANLYSFVMHPSGRIVFI